METTEKLLDRATYRKIKNYTKDEMADFCSRIYMTGRKAAFDELNLEQMRSEISAIKGIGEVRLGEIMTIIEQALGISNKEES